MLLLRIDPHSGVPVYRQIRDQILHVLAAGGMKTGDQLPSIRELATALTINPATVSKAYAELEREGAVETQRGKGVFVRDAEGKFSAQEREILLRRMLRQLSVEAIQMGVSPENLRTWFEEEIQEMK